MKNYILFSATLLILLLCWGCKEDDPDPVIPSGPTEIAGGVVSGTWEQSGSPFMINGDIEVHDGETLLIEPGVELIFTGHYRFDIDGCLLAVGTSEDMITFTSEDPDSTWNGLRFEDINPQNEGSILIHCIIEKGFAKIDEPYSNQSLDYDNSGGGIYLRKSNNVHIESCIIRNNKALGDKIKSGGGGIAIFECEPVIHTNSIYNNHSSGHGGGIATVNCSVTISNNLIYNNTGFGGGGIAICTEPDYYNVKPLIINNTIVNNHAQHGGGLDFHLGAAYVVNNIVYNNSVHGDEPTSVGKQVHIGWNYSSLMYNNDFEEGYDAFAFNKTYDQKTISAFENNIEEDPQFINDLGDFNLSNSSPCIEAGIDGLEVNGIWHDAPAVDYYGNPRPAPIGSSPDMGAIEHSN
jgi:hypothetical protein